MESRPGSAEVQPRRADQPEVAQLAAELERLPEDDALDRLRAQSDARAAAVLGSLPHARAIKLLPRLEKARRAAVLAAAPADQREHWTRALAYPEGSVGRLMDPPVAVFAPQLTAQEAVERLREQVKQAFITYGYVTETDGRLVGVLVMRDLLLAERHQRLAEIMLRDPFWLAPETAVADAMRQVLHRHYPVYPVCDGRGRLVGLVRGSVLFQEQAIEISAQPGRMVGVEEEERVATPWWRSLKFRHPWLQLNLLTAFVAAAVVGAFEETINQVVALAVFLPVLAGQSGNTGC
ncbi:CBS domain-containing protein [Nitrospira sp. Kam-Ns4a]